MKKEYYRGWVPTITGNLSFSTIGLGRFPKKLFKLFHSFDECRWTVVAQMRRTSDALFGPMGDLLNYKERETGKHIFLFFGQCSSKSGFKTLSGPCFVINPKDYKKVRIWLNGLVDAQSETHFKQALRIPNERAIQCLEKPGNTVVGVNLHRDGEIRLSLDVELLEPEEAENIASQVYSFVRDIAHVHQHHEPSSDTILDIYKDKKEKFHWKQETLYAHFRWIIQRKRTKTSKAYANSLGVLAYAEAFHKLHIENDPNEKLVTDYLSETTKTSLKSGLKSNEVKSSESLDIFGSVFTKLVPLVTLGVAILAGLLSFTQPADPSKEFLLFSNISDWLIDRPLHIILFPIFSWLIYVLSIFGRRRVMRNEIVKDFFRLALSTNYFLSLLISGSIALGLFAIAAGLISS